MTAGFLDQLPRISSDQSRGGGGTSWINPRKCTKGPSPPTKFSDTLRIEPSDAVFMTATDAITNERLEDPGGTHSTAVKRVFQDLRGTRHIRFGRKSENNHLQLFGGAGKASQHKKWGYIPILDGRTVPWISPRERDLSTRSSMTEEVKNGHDRSAEVVLLSVLGNIPTTTRDQQTDFLCHAHRPDVREELATTLLVAALHAHLTSLNVMELATTLPLRMTCTSPNVGEELATSTPNQQLLATSLATTMITTHPIDDYADTIPPLLTQIPPTTLDKALPMPF
jgi:hypothetical protein